MFGGVVLDFMDLEGAVRSSEGTGSAGYVEFEKQIPRSFFETPEIAAPVPSDFFSHLI